MGKTKYKKYLKKEDMMDKLTPTTKKPYYSTSDIYVAAFLHCLGQKLLRLDDSDRGRCYFGFEDPEKCEELAGRFWRKEAKVYPLEYMSSFKTLIELIFGQGRL